MNYFELFSVPVGPSVDRAVISRNYISLQKEFHPDFFTGSSQSEQEMVLEKSADINRAYKIFQNPDRTIEYFLRYSGLITPDEKMELPTDFLMEMMELNEELSDKPEKALNSIESFQSKLDEEAKVITDNYWTGMADGESLHKLKLNYYKKKYLNRILERLDG